MKLKTCGTDGNVLKLLAKYLKERQEHVVSSEQSSSWKNLSAGVRQGSAMGPLFFLDYINALPDGVRLLCKTFADDIPLYGKP